MLKKLRNKLLLLNMISLAAVVVASFSIIFFILSSDMRKADQDRLASIPTDVITNAMMSERSGTAADDGSEAGVTKPFIDNAGPDLPIDYSRFFVINLNENGMLSIFSRMDLDEDDYIAAASEVAESGRANTGDIRIADSHWLYSYNKAALRRGGATGPSLFNGALYSGESMVFLNVDDTDRAIYRLFVSMVVTGGCVVAGLFLISLAFSNRALRPTEESLSRQRRFVADASHELKTPLAIIDANADAALGSMASEPEARMWVERIGEESGRMRRLVDDLLFLARSEDAADVAMERLPVDLSLAAEREIGRVEAVLFERGIGVEFKSPAAGPVIVKADQERVRQILLILLDNAMKYTDDGGLVVVEVGRGRKNGFVKVSNTGAGIPAGDLPHIFDRFYRADKARTSSGAGGHGLGLSIAKTIAERSGGMITAYSASGMTTFTLELPLN